MTLREQYIDFNLGPEIQKVVARALLLKSNGDPEQLNKAIIEFNKGLTTQMMIMLEREFKQ